MINKSRNKIDLFKTPKTPDLKISKYKLVL